MQPLQLPLTRLALALACCVAIGATEADDSLIADFEGTDYGDWTVTGDAFGPGPARGTLPGQMPVSGYRGEGLVNTFYKGDDTKGTLNSPEFKIERKRINFLIGGGYHPGKACINLMIGGKVVRTATGGNKQPGGTEHLTPHSWDVAELLGEIARIQIVDDVTGGWGHINIDHIVQSDREPVVPDEREELLARANASVRRAAERVKNDRNRPTYHVLPPANWINDPNGPIFHNGYYHLFYQHNPYGDDWGHMHWGHVRSRDLAHWEHLPIALWPTLSQGENHIFSGCAVKAKDGQVMLVYTSIGNRLPEQWAAVPEDDDLIKWKKHPANPIMTEQLHGDRKIHEWRDPYVFRHAERAYMVLGGNLNASQGGQAVVNVYRAENDELTRWKYLGVLFQHPDAAVKNIECPLFFQVGNQWVLIVSPHGSPHYFVGELDSATMQFTARHRGVVDPGQFYAPNCLQEDGGRRVLWGWVTGFPGGRGWRHCMTLPRVLEVAPDGSLIQRPAPELSKLRGERFGLAELHVADAVQPIQEVRGDTLEIVARFEPGDAKEFGLKLRCSDDAKRAVTIGYDGSQLDVAGVNTPLKLPAGMRTLDLHVFLDRSVLEVYAAGGRVCVSRVIDAADEHVGVAVFAAGGRATLQAFDAWRIESAW